MDAAPLRLTDLVNRGMLAMHEAQQTDALPRAAADQTPARTPGRSSSFNTPPAMPVHGYSEDAKRLLMSADRLIERLKWLPRSAPDDPLLIRRHIMHSVELFLADICSKR